MKERELGLATALLALRPVAVRLVEEEIVERELAVRERRGALEQRIELRRGELAELRSPRLFDPKAALGTLVDEFGEFVFIFFATVVVAFIAGAIVQGVLPGDNTTAPWIAFILVLAAPPVIFGVAAYVDHAEALAKYEAQRNELQGLVAEDSAALATSLEQEDGDRRSVGRA